MAARLRLPLNSQLSLCLSYVCFSSQSLIISPLQDMNTYVQAVDSKRVEGSFFRAVLAVRKDSFEEAQRCIDRAREGLVSEVAVLLQESYERAYSVRWRLHHSIDGLHLARERERF